MCAAPSRPDEPFLLGDEAVRELGTTYGTPLYVLDEATLRHRIQRYRAALTASWPRTELTFATKANSTLGVLAIAHQEGCILDVASEGELRAAIAAGVPASKCHLHGNFKPASELEFALNQGIREIVVDSLDELETLGELARSAPCPPLLFRIAPGVDPQTHAKISTGQSDTKFGLSLELGDVHRAVARGLELGLPLIGVHAHVGSQLIDPEAQRAAGAVLGQLARTLLADLGWRIQVLNVGGGLGVRYTEADQPMPVEEYCALVAHAVREALSGTDLTPILVHEPGRSLVAEAGVTLYQVGPIKQAKRDDGSLRTYVAVDGGLSDNPRPALYGSRYRVSWTPADPRQGAFTGENQRVTVSGRHCETDTLFPDLLAPVNLRPGDWAQVRCTGAYNASMASNYNRFRRPATVLCREDGSVILLQDRESWDALLARDHALPCPAPLP